MQSFGSPNITVFDASFMNNCTAAGNVPSASEVEFIRKLKSSCNNNSQCAIVADRANINPDEKTRCPTKLLKFSYGCGSDGNRSTLSLTEGSTVNLSCEKGPLSMIGSLMGNPPKRQQPKGPVSMPSVGQTDRKKEHFVSIGEKGRVYKTFPPCRYHGRSCPYYWNCRPDVSCPAGWSQSFYTAGGDFQIFKF